MRANNGTWGFVETLVPELCDKSCLRWGPHHNAFMSGTPLHKEHLEEINFSCGFYTRADPFSLTRTCYCCCCCCCCCCHCCCDQQHCKSPAFFFALVCCCMNFLLVFLLASSVTFLSCGTHSSVTFMTLLIESHDGLGSLTEIGASALLARKARPENGAERVMSYK